MWAKSITNACNKNETYVDHLPSFINKKIDYLFKENKQLRHETT